MKTAEAWLETLRDKRDVRWLAIWALGLLGVLIWDLLFLNGPALSRVVAGYFNTLCVAFFASALTLGAGWAAAVGLHFLEERGRTSLYLFVTFDLNLVRSVPQVVGVLFGYVFIAGLLERGTVSGPFAVFGLMGLCMGLFIFIEMADLMRERIAHFRRLDFYDAMQVCGIARRRIVNFDILWKNSRAHILNKFISVFGMAVFLQCSVDFIISVGLSNRINAISLPATLGSLLARIDSKQDILAVGHALTHPAYLMKLPFVHLQGLTVAFLIVFTLLAVDRIASGYAERNRL